LETLKSGPTTTEEKSPQEDRIVLLSDGVFAIAMTLLILDVRLPDGIPNKTLQDVLLLIMPKFVGYVISFAVIARYWMLHRSIIKYLKRIDASFIWINLVLLFFVTALPIPTAFTLQNQYPDPLHLSVTIYALSLALIGFTVYALWLNATWKHRLVDPNMTQNTIDDLMLRLLIAPVIFLLSLVFLLLPVPHDTVYFSWLTLPVIFFFLNRLQPLLFPNAEKHHAS
jgi:TMEM175 potassium channel family protein